MEKNIKTSQKSMSKTTGSSKVSEEQTPLEEVVFNERGSISIDSEEENGLQELYNVLKSTLHGENNKIKLCEWQLPPNSKKASCVPVSCSDRNIE